MADAGCEQPEFHIVVRRPGRGPLAPHRLTIVIAFITLINGRELLAVAQDGAAADSVLIRSAIAGTFAWFVLGRVNAILKAATPPRKQPTPTDA